MGNTARNIELRLTAEDVYLLRNALSVYILDSLTDEFRKTLAPDFMETLLRAEDINIKLEQLLPPSAKNYS